MAQVVCVCYIVVLIAAEVVFDIREWREKREDRWEALSTPLFDGILISAVLYALGYFRYLPELLGRKPGSAPSDKRWRAFFDLAGWLLAGLSFFQAIFLTVLGLKDHHLSVQDYASAIFVFLVGIFTAGLLCFGVPRRILDFTQRGAVENLPGARRAHILVRARTWFEALSSRFRPRVSLGSGGALVLLSLYLVTGMDGCNDYPGYGIVIGRAEWPIGGGVERWFYIVALAMAVLALVAALARRLRGLLQRNWLKGLTAVASATALFLIPISAPGAFAFAFLHGGSDSGGAALALQCLFAISPVILWLWFSRRTAQGYPDRWTRIRDILIILYLPMVVSGVAYFLLLAAAVGYYGFASCIVGLLLLWWGFVQLGAQQPKAPAGSGASHTAPLRN